MLIRFITKPDIITYKSAQVEMKSISLWRDKKKQTKPGLRWDLPPGLIPTLLGAYHQTGPHKWFIERLLSKQSQNGAEIILNTPDTHVCL